MAGFAFRRNAVEVEVCVHGLDGLARQKMGGKFFDDGLAECTRCTREPAKPVVSLRAHGGSFNRGEWGKGRHGTQEDGTGMRRKYGLIPFHLLYKWLIPRTFFEGFVP